MLPNGTGMTKVAYLNWSKDRNIPGEDTVAAALEEAGGHMQKEHVRKCVVISLDDFDGNYNTRFFNAGMTMSELIALLEYLKMQCLCNMLGLDYGQEIPKK